MEGLSKKAKRERTHGHRQQWADSKGKGVSGGRRGYGGINGDGIN